MNTTTSMEAKIHLEKKEVGMTKEMLNKATTKKRKLLCDYNWIVSPVPKLFSGNDDDIEKIENKDPTAITKTTGTSLMNEDKNEKLKDDIVTDVQFVMDGPPVKLGIDEAGRGPVLGPMTYGCAYWRIEDDEEISALGYDDSKAITAQTREKLFDGIANENAYRIGWIVVDIPATAISALMLKQSPTSLNRISHECAISMIECVLEKGVNVQEVYVDTVGDPDVYQRKLTRRFHNKIKFTVTKKADSLFRVVSAASICAKVIRDKLVSEWVYEEGDKKLAEEKKPDVGSGYPGDPKTKDYIEKYFDKIFSFSSFVRHSWSTVTKVEDARGVKVEWDEPDDEADEKQANIKSFFTKKGLKKEDVRVPFFKKRGLKRVRDDFFV